MKKLFLALAAISCLSTSAYANCALPVHSAPDIKAKITADGGWPISDQKCEDIKKHHLALWVNAEYAVYDNVSIAWASVKLVTKETNIISLTGYQSTQLDRVHAGMEVASALLVKAVDQAIAGLDVENAAQEIKQLQAKAAYQP